MALNLAELQHAQIRDMILNNRPTAEIANVVDCSERSIFTIKPFIFIARLKPPQVVLDVPEALRP